MKIAIIAWGSLVWDARNLRIDGKWNNSGPRLKFEFSRVSRDGRLTLVLDPDNGEEAPTYYAQSIRSDLGDAIADLRDREGTIRSRIGFVDTINNRTSHSEFPNQIDVFRNIASWCSDTDFDAAIWTALTSQFYQQTGKDFSVSNAILYLNSLPKSARKNALKYVRNAPPEIVTPVRREIEKPE